MGTQMEIISTKTSLDKHAILTSAFNELPRYYRDLVQYELLSVILGTYYLSASFFIDQHE